MEYLAWRQMNNWRNHNNAYAYWVFHKMGYKPSEISKKLKGLKTEELHEIMFRQGVNLAKTLQWQRRGILVYKQPFLRKVENHFVTRWKINENWKLPLFTSGDGVKLIKQILEWTRQKRKK
jgi:tRNA(His) 5'-end guanylyltransferase